MRTCRNLLTLVLAIGGIALRPACAAESVPFVVHEWGTFTTLQNDEGRELPGINIDDEPVPEFVHNLAPYLLNNAILSNEHWIYRQKGAPRQHPMVTMRLETPVVYFHPGADGTMPKSVDVTVHFCGGWLTEFYPFAKADMPGLGRNTFDFGALSPKTIGTLTWKDVRLGTKQAGPETDSHVWLAPRNVKAADVSVSSTTEDGKTIEEHERYLFYRGVANQRAPLRVSTDRKVDELTIRANFDDALCKGEAEIPVAWLVDIQPDGRTAYRAIPAFTVTGDLDRIASTTRRNFSEGDFDQANLQRLRVDMQKALVTDGLYEDEAAAMLATWERAYFKTAGLRLFYLVPRVWTDHYLPLAISGDPEVERVMVGRIELVTDRQRELLQKVATGKCDPRWIDEIRDGAAKIKFLSGRSDFGDLGVTIPDNYKAYLQLGRFRNTLVIAEAKEMKELEPFVSAYNIRPYNWAK